MVKESYAVIGLGQFGSSIVDALMDYNQEVLAIDNNEVVINQYADKVMRAVIADAQNEDVLSELDLGSYDHVYISIGRNVQASIMATLIAKELGCKDITARAENENHARVLEKIGADQVVRPEKDIAERLVYLAVHPNIVKHLELSSKVSIAELTVTNMGYVGKTLNELNLTNRFNVSVVVITSANRDTVIAVPKASARLKLGDKVTVIGNMVDIQKLSDVLQVK